MKINGFGAQGHVQKSRNHEHEGSEGSHISTSESYKFKLEQNTTAELLSTNIPVFPVFLVFKVSILQIICFPQFQNF